MVSVVIRDRVKARTNAVGSTQRIDTSNEEATHRLVVFQVILSIFGHEDGLLKSPATATMKRR